MTVTLAALSESLRERWRLFTHDGRSHIVCTPGVTSEHIDAFLNALANVSQPEPAAPDRCPATGSVPRQLRRPTPAAATTTTRGSTR
jgi:hypothetical protein